MTMMSTARIRSQSIGNIAALVYAIVYNIKSDFNFSPSKMMQIPWPTLTGETRQDKTQAT
jgi:hypothetical protein